MTKVKFVADDEIGKISIKYWELIRRVKEGTLTSKYMLDKLQQIIEGIDTGHILTITHRVQDQVAQLQLEGRLSTSWGSAKILDTIADLLEDGIKKFILNTDKAYDIDESGMQVVLLSFPRGILREMT